MESIKFPFPIEFLEYGRHYGTGEIVAGGYGIWIANPLDSAYPRWILKTCETIRTIGDPPELRSTRFYPEPDGCVPFAESWSGNLLFFSFAGADCHIVSYAGDPNELMDHQCGVLEFLVKMYSGTLDPEFFPNKEMRKRSAVFKKRSWLK